MSRSAIGVEVIRAPNVSQPNPLDLIQPFDPLLCPLGHQPTKKLLGGSSAFERG